MADRTPIPAGAYERLVRQLRADMQRKQFLEQMQAARQAEDMKGRHSVGLDERRPTNPNLISNALLAGTLGGAMSAAGLPSVGLRAGLIGGGLTDATLNAGNPEGGAEISGALAAAGALGRHSIPAAIAALGASSSEAAGMPFHSWMKRLNSLNKVEPTAMYVNPTNAELLSMMRDARETYPTSPTVRLLRDQRSNDVYGVEGSSILHDDMRKHLKLKYEFSPGSQGGTLPELDTELHFLKSLPRLAGGGAIKRLGKRAMSQFDELRPSSVAPQGALSVVKPKGGNWLAGSVEDALSPLKERLGEVDPARLAVIRDRLGDPTAGNVGEVLNSWIEGPLTKYVKTRMASPEDEVRKLAEQGVLHFEPTTIRERSPLMDKVVGRRETAGFPIQGIADAPLARNWENTSDSIIRNLEARDLSSAERAASFGGKSNIPGDTIVHEMNPFASGAGISDLGFNHLIDELSNALNPNSGLPPHLQLTPEAVKQMSMEKAVRRVADINAHRAAVQAAANAELANKAMVVREYTDEAMPNPKGLRWVELKANPKTDELGNVVNRGDRDLADQLKYEGGTMGHCVGGYCDDVLSGRSRIFSLRDAKGEPHVTVEVGSQPRNIGQEDIPNNYIDEAMEKLGIDSPEGQWGREEEIDRLAGDLWRKDNPGTHRIVQIKGKQNRAPNPEYLPFVQDFVRNSPLGGAWSDVGDLGNTGLRRVEDAFNKNELAKLRAANIPVPEGYATSADIEELHKQFNLLTTGTEFNPARAWERMQYDSHIDDLDIDLPDRAAPFAHGGAVTKQLNPADNFQGIIAAIEEALA